MTQTSQKICILGGGFGGLFTALRLSQLPWASAQPEITLVDQNDHFLFTP
ncbi:MAG: NAD(P)/FAD-dependent oxidoreductase, partial [Cyanobacteria bacterium P01_A01_bin.17]